MNRHNRWKQIGLGAGFLAVIASPEALHALVAAPQSQPSAKAAPADNTFVPACKANEVADTRPDPAWVGASFARDNCWAPEMPALINGYTATDKEINAWVGESKRYMARADAFQRCIGDFIALQRARADTAKKPVDANLILIENHRIIASQANKKKAYDQIVLAVGAYNELGSECPE